MNPEARPNLFRRVARHLDETIAEGMEANPVRNTALDYVALIGITKALSEHFVEKNDADALLAGGAAAWIFAVITTDAYFKGRAIIKSKKRKDDGRG